MRPPYPVDIVPQIQLFLNRRRTKLDAPLRLMEEVGLDRPSFTFGTAVSVNFPDGAGIEDLVSPYSVRHDTALGLAVAAAGAGLVEERGGRWYGTEKGRAYATRLQQAAHIHLATLEPIPLDDLGRLASLLERALQRAVAAVPAVPSPHVPRVSLFREGTTSTHPMVPLENAVYGLWMVRDDCHVAAWMTQGLTGPDLDVLTRVWRAEGGTPAELAAKLGHPDATHVESSLARLRLTGQVGEGMPLRVTERGGALRQRTEDETDRLFFDPWPEDVGAEHAWIRERLEAVNQALA